MPQPVLLSQMPISFSLRKVTSSARTFIVAGLLSAFGAEREALAGAGGGGGQTRCGSWKLSISVRRPDLKEAMVLAPAALAEDAEAAVLWLLGKRCCA
jgi:hypothetical protein